MGIFAKDHRAGVTLVDVAHQSPRTGIHRAIYIALGVVAATLILHGARRIHLPRIIIERLEVFPVARLIAERPCDDAGEIAVAGNHPPHSLFERDIPSGHVGKRPVGMCLHAVALYVGLVHHVEAVFRTEFIPLPIIGIMAIAHGVDVVEFHEAYVFQHRRDIHGAPFPRVVLMTVDSLEEHCLAIDELTAAVHLHRAESERMGKRLLLLSGRIAVGDDQKIRVGSLRAPGGCILHHMAKRQDAICGGSHRVAVAPYRVAAEGKGYVHPLPFRRGIHLQAKREVAVAIGIHEGCGNFEILDSRRGTRRQRNAAFDATVFPIVLPF